MALAGPPRQCSEGTGDVLRQAQHARRLSVRPELVKGRRTRSLLRSAGSPLSGATLAGPGVFQRVHFVDRGVFSRMLTTRRSPRRGRKVQLQGDILDVVLSEAKDPFDPKRSFADAQDDTGNAVDGPFPTSLPGHGVARVSRVKMSAEKAVPNKPAQGPTDLFSRPAG